MMSSCPHGLWLQNDLGKAETAGRNTIKRPWRQSEEKKREYNILQATRPESGRWIKVRHGGEVWRSCQLNVKDA